MIRQDDNIFSENDKEDEIFSELDDENGIVSENAETNLVFKSLLNSITIKPINE